LRATAGRPLSPRRLTLQFAKIEDLRYGENPHQAAAFYRDGNPISGGIAGYTQIQGRNFRTTTSPTPTPPGSA